MAQQAAAGLLNVSTPAPFATNTEPSRLATTWTKWLTSFDIYITAAGIKDAARKKALLLHCVGEGLQDIFATLTVAAADDDNDEFKQATTALTGHFAPKKNKRFERHLFRNCAQGESETMNQYVTKLRTLVKSCEYTDANDAIIDQVIEKCFSKKLRKALLKQSDADLTLDKVLELARVSETVARQSKNFEQPGSHCEGEFIEDGDHINRISRKSKRYQKSKFVRRPPAASMGGNRHSNQGAPDRQSTITPQSKQTSCFRCGDPSHLAHQCGIDRRIPCLNCGKPGHLAKVCKSPPIEVYPKTPKSGHSQVVNYVQEAETEDESESDSSDDDWVLAINSERVVAAMQDNDLLHPIVAGDCFIPY